MIPEKLAPYFEAIQPPHPESHKGQNGKLLIIGGSELFHAASKWSLDVASKFVDMVLYSSVPSNNELVEAELIKEAKQNFWNGIVIPRGELEDYAKQADCILIGPGMERSEETEQLVNSLLKKYPEKKWVIDAGALQMADPHLFKANHILTPHAGEMKIISDKLAEGEKIEATVLLKGPVDTVRGDGKEITVEGGNAGMTKGGTGDVLAGLVAALYCTHDALPASVVASFINKKAGEHLAESVGPYFNASDLVEAVPIAFWQAIKP